MRATSAALGRIARRGIARSVGVAPQAQTGKSGGQVQPCSSSRRKRLTIRSSSEWNEITARRPCGRSISSAGGKRALELAELVVDLDPQRLEDALGGMPLAEAGGRRDRLLDHLDQVAGALERAAARGGGTIARAIWRA